MRWEFRCFRPAFVGAVSVAAIASRYPQVAAATAKNEMEREKAVPRKGWATNNRKMANKLCIVWHGVTSFSRVDLYHVLCKIAYVRICRMVFSSKKIRNSALGPECEVNDIPYWPISFSTATENSIVKKTWIFQVDLLLSSVRSGCPYRTTPPWPMLLKAQQYRKYAFIRSNWIGCIGHEELYY